MVLRSPVTVRSRVVTEDGGKIRRPGTVGASGLVKRAATGLAGMNSWKYLFTDVAHPQYLQVVSPG